MKIERIRDKKKYYLIISILVLIIAVLILKLSRAEYVTKEDKKLVNGNIEYTLGDFNSVAMYVDNEEIESEEELPSNVVLAKTICKKNGEDIPNVSATYNMSTKKLTIQPIGIEYTKCYLYFETTKTLDETLALLGYPNKNTIPIAGSVSGNITTFAGTSCANGTNNGGNCKLQENGVYKVTTSGGQVSGTTYYYRGTVNNNFVKFGKNKEGQDLYWRIVRINENGSIRLIYNGTSIAQIGVSTQIGKARWSHPDAYWTSASDNSYTNDAAYVGYMWRFAGATSYNGAHQINRFSANSNVKAVIDEWYEENLLGTKYENYIDTTVGFCGDRTVDKTSIPWATGNGYGNGTNAVFKALTRVYASSEWDKSNVLATYECINQNDYYTVYGSNIGNESLQYPIGLLTSDDVIFAGARGYHITESIGNNKGFWLYTGQSYWTMSPNDFNVDTLRARMLYVYSEGPIRYTTVSSSMGIRPVINLKLGVLKSGNGSSIPFTV